jgi:hypothetical protein
MFGDDAATEGEQVKRWVRWLLIVVATMVAINAMAWFLEHVAHFNPRN